MDWPVRENSPCLRKISAASGFRIGFKKSPTRAASSSMVPSRFFIVLTMNLGFDGGCSRLKLVRPQWPERLGIGVAFGAAGAEHTIMAVAAIPKPAGPKTFVKVMPIAVFQCRRYQPV